MQISAVILAGGRGSRMGGADKGLIMYQDQPLIQHVLTRIQPQVETILINANRNLDTYQTLGWPVINDHNDQFDGPLAGMQAGLHAANTDWVLTVPCDSPHLPADLALHLQQAIASSQALLAIARSQSGTHPVISLLHRSLRSSLDDYLAEGGRKVSAWQQAQSHVLVDFDDELAFTNLNHPLPDASAT